MITYHYVFMKGSFEICPLSLLSTCDLLKQSLMSVVLTKCHLVNLKYALMAFSITPSASTREGHSLPPPSCQPSLWKCLSNTETWASSTDSDVPSFTAAQQVMCITISFPRNTLFFVGIFFLISVLLSWEHTPVSITRSRSENCVNGALSSWSDMSLTDLTGKSRTALLKVLGESLNNKHHSTVSNYYLVLLWESILRQILSQPLHICRQFNFRIFINVNFLAGNQLYDTDIMTVWHPDDILNNFHFDTQAEKFHSDILIYGHIDILT